jgi:predicted PurR-regulated permease PerM
VDGPAPDLAVAEAMVSPAPRTPPSGFRPAGFQSLAITGLAMLGVLHALRLGRELILPVVLAMLLALLLQPVTRLLRRVRVPRVAAPALVLLLLVAGLGGAVYRLSGPAGDWVVRAPQDLKMLDTRVRRLLRSVEGVTRTAEQVDQIAASASSDTPQVEIKPRRLSSVVFGGARHLLASGLIVLVLTYFFLSSGGRILGKLPSLLPRDHGERVLGIVQNARAQISRYLLAVTVINVGIGLLTAGIMAALGMPTPLLLGAVAAALNFVPYFGPIVNATLLAMVALISFDDVGRALLPPLCYLGVHVIEANFLTPQLLGSRLPLNPLAIFLSFIFWLWIWGVPGAVISVPILATIKIICDRSERFAVVGELLGR